MPIADYRFIHGCGTGRRRGKSKREKESYDCDGWRGFCFTSDVGFSRFLRAGIVAEFKHRFNQGTDFVGTVTAIKFDPVGGYSVFDPRQPTLERMDMSERFCKLIREAVGDKADILFGTHGQYTVSGAKRMARRLEKYDPLWFEEPTPPERPEMMAEVARHTSIPIATGERLTTKYEFARVLETGAASILQPALGRVGGILECKKIAGMAEAHYAQMAPHLYCGPIEAAANIQLAACIPNFLILESIQQLGGFHAKLLKTKIEWADGYVIPSKDPGLGVELNEEVALAHPYTGKGLHLDMAQHPLGYY